MNMQGSTSIELPNTKLHNNSIIHLLVANQKDYIPTAGTPKNLDKQSYL